MPNGVQVWVDAEAPHTAVYVDESLCGEDGELTAEGMLQVNRAMSAQSLGWAQPDARSPGTSPLRAVAG
jgi:hypothetical protein